MHKGGLRGDFLSCAVYGPACVPSWELENELAALSNELARAVEQAGRTVVAGNARPRFASSGALCRSGIVVTAAHAIRRRDEIGITLPDGRTTCA